MTELSQRAIENAYWYGVSAQQSDLPMTDNEYDPTKEPELYESWCRGYHDSEDDE
jgi:hypothetical protein